MGQYYLTVNVDKRQYLDPHKFGAGLKLMEFSGQAESIGQALCILLAQGNNRGGGDLRSDDPLIGSWAGDRVIVAGDYMDPWEFVPEDLKDKPYTRQERVYGGGVTTTVDEVFGQRDGEDYDETLYHAARVFFEDISDKIIKVVAEGDTPYHPWAAIDKSAEGWRHYPASGVLPETPPKEPIAGEKAWLTYQKHAVSQGKSLVDSLIYYITRHPDQQAKLKRLLNAGLKASCQTS